MCKVLKHSIVFQLDIYLLWCIHPIHPIKSRIVGKTFQIYFSRSTQCHEYLKRFKKKKKCYTITILCKCHLVLWTPSSWKTNANSLHYLCTSRTNFPSYYMYWSSPSPKSIRSGVASLIRKPLHLLQNRTASNTVSFSLRQVELHDRATVRYGNEKKENPTALFTKCTQSHMHWCIHIYTVHIATYMHVFFDRKKCPGWMYSKSRKSSLR